MAEEIGLQTEEQILEQTFEPRDMLSLDVEDNELVLSIKRRVNDSRSWFKREKNLVARQIKNKDYLFGQQLDEKSIKKYNARYVDNLIYESEATIKPIALSRLPDLQVTPGPNNENKDDIAKDLTDVINSVVKQRTHRKVLGLSFKHLPVYYIGIIKVRWDPTKGKHGDYVFEVVHPDHITLDHTTKTKNPDEMGFIVHHYELPLKEAIIRFPDKEEAIYKELGIEKEDEGKNMATPVKIDEAWFTDYFKKDNEWQKVEGVAWITGDTLLKKMKNPNWDWEGEEQLFTYDGITNEKKLLKEEELRDAVINGQPIDIFKEKRFYNFFQHPKKPFMFLGYDEWGEMPYDETSRIEQVLYLQDNVNKRGKQITEIADGARGKNIWSSKSGLKKSDIEELDMNDPDEDVYVHGDLREVHELIPGQQPTAALFQEQDINRERLFAKMGTNATTRGQIETDTATTAQIARESDFGRIDDLTEETINAVAEEMAGWAMQMIKLFYDEEHMVSVLGENGRTVYKALNRDMILDGMEVSVSASGVDKVMAQRRAMEMASSQMIDPLSFFEDLGVSQPEERAKRLILYNLSPEQYMAEYVMGLKTAGDMATALNGTTPPTGAGDQQLTSDIAMLSQGQIPQPPQQVTPEYMQGINTFLQSPEFQALPPEIQQAVASYAQQLIDLSSGGQQPNIGV